MSAAAAMVTAAMGAVDGAMVRAAVTASGRRRSVARRVGFIHDTSDKHIALIVEHEGVVENVVAGAGLLNFELPGFFRVEAGADYQRKKRCQTKHVKKFHKRDACNIGYGIFGFARDGIFRVQIVIGSALIIVIFDTFNKPVCSL